MLQTQRLVQNVPINNIVSGYSNDIKTSIAVISGSNNKVITPNTSVVGNNNFVFGKTGINNITGLSNSTTGTINVISGSNNLIKGDSISVNGDNNSIRGSYFYINGSSNITNSLYSIQPNQNIYIYGDNNLATGEYIRILGNGNTFSEGWSYTTILGNGNYLNGGLYIEDYSGLTNSGPTVSVDPYLLQGTNLHIIGDGNTVGTQSTNVKVIGDNNILSPSVSNSIVLANGENIDTTNNSQFYIGSSYDINIKGAVLPCNLIQDFTPSQAADPSYVDGAITKDDNNIWVRTTGLGWRQIPFNNSYGSFYDTTTQTNPTASLVNYLTYNSGIGTNVSIVDSSKVTVDFDGLYNIQFSAQVNKPSGGTNDIDIWLMYNGQNVDWSNTRITLQGNNAKTVAAWNWVQSMTASSNFQIAWSSSDKDIQIYSLGSQSLPTRPGIPSVLLTVDKISSI